MVTVAGAGGAAGPADDDDLTALDLPGLDQAALDRLRPALDPAIVRGEPSAPRLAEVVAPAAAALDRLAPPPPDGDPYSRTIVHADDRIEVMVARWRPGERCAPHDHGGSSGIVMAVQGTFDERRYAWHRGELGAAAELEHRPGSSFRFGPEVIHDMAAADGGVTLHVYAPPPAGMRVFDLDRGDVLELGSDHGAWLPGADHPRRPIAEVLGGVDERGETADTGSADDAAAARPVIWIGHTTRYRGGSASFAAAAATMARERAAARPDAEVIVAALDGKADLAAAMDALAAAGREIDELHFVGHSGMYGPMFGSVEWPEQFSPHEWRELAIPFATDARAWFHACRTARWFAPFFARTFGVTTYGNQDYTTVSGRSDRFAWAGRHPERREELYLVAVPGKRSHGWAGSVRKYLGAAVVPMVASHPAPPDGETSYDRVAELYDRAYVDIRVREAEWAWIVRHAEEARTVLGRPLRILEVGCGNGALLRALDDLGHVTSAVGLDDSAAMVERARARSTDRDRLRFDRIVGPVIDQPDDAFDVVLSFLSFRYLDWDPLMDEVRRVLVPGGRLWVVDMVAKPVGVRDLPLLARSTAAHLRMPKRYPTFARDLAALTSHPDWQAMLRHNPIRADHEYRWYLESRFPGRRLELLTVGSVARVVAFDSGPLPKGRSAPLSFP